MNDSVSILVAVFLILVALRWMLGGPQQGSAQQQNQHRAQQRRPQHRATPQMVEMVRAVFPDIPQAAIVADLQRTGSVEATIDNALRDGGLPMPSPPVTQTTQSSNASSSSTATQKTPTYSNLMKRYNIEEGRDEEDLVEPPKVWESDAQKRQEMLRKRKEFMVLQARKKLLEKQFKAATSSTSQGSTINPEPNAETSKNSYDEMSVEQLNHLTPEERRRHLLDAVERRNPASNTSMQ